MATLIRMEEKHQVPEAVMWWVQWLITAFSVRAKFRDIFIIFRASSEIFCLSHSYTWTHHVHQLLLVTRVMTESGCHLHPKHPTTTSLPIIIPLCPTWPTLSINSIADFIRVRTFYIISFTHKVLASCVYNSHFQVPIDGVTLERCVMWASSGNSMNSSCRLSNKLQDQCLGMTNCKRCHKTRAHVFHKSPNILVRIIGVNL
jgi:hypothetical protein